jgi:hypothetical protein
MPHCHKEMTGPSSSRIVPKPGSVGWIGADMRPGPVGYDEVVIELRSLWGKDSSFRRLCSAQE